MDILVTYTFKSNLKGIKDQININDYNDLMNSSYTESFKNTIYKLS